MPRLPHDWLPDGFWYVLVQTGPAVTQVVVAGSRPPTRLGSIAEGYVERRRPAPPSRPENALREGCCPICQEDLHGHKTVVVHVPDVRRVCERFGLRAEARYTLSRGSLLESFLLPELPGDSAHPISCLDCLGGLLSRSSTPACPICRAPFGPDLRRLTSHCSGANGRLMHPACWPKEGRESMRLPPHPTLRQRVASGCLHALRELLHWFLRSFGMSPEDARQQLFAADGRLLFSAIACYFCTLAVASVVYLNS